jgi:hypothetical protein
MVGGDLDAKGPGEKLDIFWPVGPERSNLYLGNSIHLLKVEDVELF